MTRRMTEPEVSEGLPIRPENRVRRLISLTFHGLTYLPLRIARILKLIVLWLLAAPPKAVTRGPHLFRLAVVAMSGRPVRSVMMTLTIGAGVAVVTLSAAVISGFGHEIERLSFGAYARSLVITPNVLASDQARFSRLTDLDRLIEGIGEDLIEGSAAWRIAYQVPVSIQGRRADLTVFGVRGDYRYEADMDVAQGRAFTASELETSARQCMLGAGAAAALFPDSRAAGQTIRVDGVNCYIQGVFEPGDTLVAARYSNAIIAPFDSAARYFMSQNTLAPNEASRLTVVLRDRESLHWARNRADRILRRQHGVPQSQASPFRFADPSAPTANMEQQRDLLSRLLIAVASGAMMAAIIGYGASSWTLAELRRRNIGLQMTLGASAGDIFVQFILENIFLGTLGGICGIAIALLLGIPTADWLGWPVQFDYPVIIASVVLGTIAGVLAGYAASSRAATTLPAQSARA
ncbi:ABC transporter permease [Hyphobacterium sp.]|uniref:ABC transporter permease n=1 Tax=Hyphobacterium sp. TaxID=2004662 RepID=UPI0037499895